MADVDLVLGYAEITSINAEINMILGYVEATGDEPYHSSFFIENWDTAAPPAFPSKNRSWSTALVTGTTVVWKTYNAGTGAMSAPYIAYADTPSATVGDQTRLYTTANINISAIANPWMQLAMQHTASLTRLDSLQVQVSTDSGLTWVNVGSPITSYRVGTAGEYSWDYIDMSAYAGSTAIMLGFLATAAAGTSSKNFVSIDDIIIIDYPVNDQVDAIIGYIEALGESVEVDSIIGYVETLFGSTDPEGETMVSVSPGGFL